VNYLQEWGSSCVDDHLTRLNVTPLEGQGPYEYLLYDAIPRRNDGRVRDHIFKQHLEERMVVSGIDVLTGSDDIWGCFKPKPAASQFRIGYLGMNTPISSSSLFACDFPS